MDDPEVIQQNLSCLFCRFTQVLAMKDLCHKQLAVWGQQTIYVQLKQPWHCAFPVLFFSLLLCMLYITETTDVN